MSCFFGVYIFGYFSPLLDAEYYIHSSSEYDLKQTLTNRTFFTNSFFSVLGDVFGKGEQLHFISAFFCTLVVYFVFKDCYKNLPRIFWLVLVLPSFAVWTSVVGKEVLAFCGFLLVIKWVVDIVLYGSGNFLVLVVGVFFAFIVRPHYAISYSFLIIVAFILPYIWNKKIFSFFVHMLFLSNFIFLFLITAFLLFDFWEAHLKYLMMVSETYFSLHEENASRAWINWSYAKDFFGNMWWGLPVSMIGPTISETIKKPVFFPFLFEGVIFIFMMIYFLFLCVKNYKNDPKVRFFIVYGFMPAILFAILIHYPFGIFNPGSALRYKQTLTPLFYFLPILLMANMKKARYEMGLA